MPNNEGPRGLDLLPIDTRIAEIREKLRNYSVVIVTATPGSGKTTRIPPALLSLTQKKILVLEPRRVAATMAAMRIAEENSWTLGKEVGYRVRFENQTQLSTRLIFLTEALLMKQMLNDGDLSDVGIIVLDEFHERSVHVDTATALLRELLELGRPDLKIVVMSATIDSARLNRFWPNSVVVDIQGVTHPLEIAKDKRAQVLRPQQDFFERVVEAVEVGFKNSPGQKDVLVFLPGVREIERSAEALEKSAQRLGFAIERLHGQLPLAEQKKILRKSSQRRVILSTNVAESAVTVDGLDTVIDSGLERISQLHPKTGHQSLDLVRISLASARQRAGRAARQGPGLAIQMWSTHDELSMASERPAELLRTEISELVLLLAGLGISNPKTLNWYEAPGEKQVNESLTLLQALGALGAGQLTDKGKRMLALPLSPRWSSLAVEADARGERDLGLELSALIQGVNAKQRRSANFLNLYSEWRSRPHEFHQVKQILEQLRGRISASQKSQNEIPLLLWKTFPDRLCRRRTGTQQDTALMVGGRGVRLPKGDFPREIQFFLALDLIEGLSSSDTQCSLYFPLADSFVEKEIFPMAITQDSVVFDEGQERFWSEKALCYQDLQLENPRRSPAPAGQVSGALAQYIRQNWEKMRPRFAGVEDWLARLRYFSRKKDPALWPIQDADLQRILEWACDGETSIKNLEKKDLLQFFSNILLGEREREFNRECPTHLTSPKGRSLKVEYAENVPPRVEIRIQDAFGWRDTPQILGEPLMVDLLAPNGRPQQRTQDLRSFWQNSYKEIRKELRARYPKHAWPEDPMSS